MFNFFRFVRFAALVAALACSSNPANADVVVEIHDADLKVGGTGTVDVMIRSTAGVESLKAFDFDLRLTPLGAVTTIVRFTDPQGDSQLNSPDYVFFNDSDAFINGSAVGTVSTVTLPQDRYVGGDVTDSGNAVSVFTSESRLVTLDVFHSVPGDPEAHVGKQFLVSLFDATFLDGSNNPIGFTSSSGTITLTSAVPEPSAFFLLTLGTGLLCNVRRKRRPHPRTPE